MTPPYRRFLQGGWWLAMAMVMLLALVPTHYLKAPVFNWWDKGQHTLVFAVMTGSALLLWPDRPMHVLLRMFVLGVAMELAQWATGWRFAEWADLAADAVGIALAWGLWAMWGRGRFSKSGRAATRP